MELVPPRHGPAADEPDDSDHPDHSNDDGPPPELPDVVQAVTGRARDLHALADRLTGDESAGGDLSAVALLRAHAGAVDDLAEHLASAGAQEPRPEPGPRGVPRAPG